MPPSPNAAARSAGRASGSTTEVVVAGRAAVAVAWRRCPTPDLDLLTWSADDDGPEPQQVRPELQHEVSPRPPGGGAPDAEVGGAKPNFPRGR